MKEKVTVNRQVLEKLYTSVDELKPAFNELLDIISVFKLNAHYNNLQNVKQCYTVMQAYLKLQNEIEKLLILEDKYKNK